MGVDEAARTCVRMAVAMQQQMVELWQEWRASGFERARSARLSLAQRSARAKASYVLVCSFRVDSTSRPQRGEWPFSAGSHRRRAPRRRSSI